MLKIPKEVTIDVSSWARNPVGSIPQKGCKLLDTDGQCCALGFLLRDCGLPSSYYLNECDPVFALQKTRANEILSSADEEALTKLSRRLNGMDSTAHHIMVLNDTPGILIITEEERRQELKNVFANDLGITLKFSDEQN